MNNLPSELKAQLDELFRNDPVAESLGVKSIDWNPGEAFVSTVITEAHTNFLGVAHGGILLTLGDIALSFASNGYGRKALAVQIDIVYHRGVKPGDKVVASATEFNRSRRFANYRIELHVDENLVASATGLAFRTDEWHLNEDDWPEDWKSKY